MPKAKQKGTRKNQVTRKKPGGLMGRIRALSSRQKMLALVVVFALIGSIMVVSSEAASLTPSQKSQLKSMKVRHDNAEDAKKAECKSLKNNKPAKKTCDAQLKTLKDNNKQEYKNTKAAFKAQTKANKVCGVSTFATHINNQGHDGASGSGSSSGASGSSGTGSSGTSGSGGSSTSGSGTSGSSGSSGGGSNGTSGSSGNNCGGQCLGVSTLAATNGAPGQPGSGSSSGSAGSSGTGSSGSSGSGDSGTSSPGGAGTSGSSNGTNGSNGASSGSSSGSNNNCR